MNFDVTDSPNQNNAPTRTWRNPRPGTTPEWLRPIIQDLERFLARPTFYNGLKVGDGQAPKKDAETGVETQPPLDFVDAWTVSQIPAEVAAELAELDAKAAALETAPIAFTRVTNVSIETPHLAANAVTADKLAALYLSVGKFIRSANYVQGSAGWAIDGNGNAEFNNVTMRGDVFAAGGKVSLTAAGVRLDATKGSDSQLSFFNNFTAKAYVYASGNDLWISTPSGQLIINGYTAVHSGNVSSYVTSGYGQGSSPSFNAVSANSVTTGYLQMNGGINAPNQSAVVGSLTLSNGFIGTKEVGLGDANSGGSGYRVLRVTN